MLFVLLQATPGATTKQRRGYFGNNALQHNKFRPPDIPPSGYARFGGLNSQAEA